MLPQEPSRQLICPACDRAAGHRLLFVKNDCRILQCEACGLGRADASSFDPKRYYTDAYFTGGHADGYADYLRTAPVLHREFSGQVDFIRALRPSGRLLEIGCAYGLFLQEAKAHYDVSGIELAEDAADYCRGSGLTVTTGVASAEVLESIGRVDIVVMLDVIEHLADPIETLNLCERILNPGGLIVLTTGDFASPMARVAGSHWRLMTPPQHLWFFTPKSFRNWASRPHLATTIDHPWKVVPLSVMAFQLTRMLGRSRVAPALASGLGVPINLFDAMRVVIEKD